ncbi:hypothetical protein VOM14_09535 [Paraburkholderia sp. MPAMCS5]|uniref:hypothetical protein n=1 Tax=Paraburkholderia sp. MPAMCS5 TaxID=3112563 RepID=UPI002E191113|nr:hypothetical protein [Paraburkholderia sp. MPAMCS5]
MQFSATEFIALAEAEATAITNFNTPSESHQEQPESKNSKPELELFSLKHKPFRDSELKFIGWNRPKNAPPITCPESSLWVDKKTGELFTQKQAQEHGITVGHSKSLGMILIQSIIQSCPPGKRDFVRYILRLRNTRGGLAVDLETALNRWIDYENPTMHSTDRARKRKALENFLYERGILANNQTFTKDLQFIADSTRKDYLGETFKFVRALPLTGQPCYERHSNSLGTETTTETDQIHSNNETQQ